jgi:DNA-binding transcriptional LysR family regulator
MKKSLVQLDRLLIFVAVAEAGGFTAAAARLGKTKKFVSQNIHQLELELGGALFVRTTRRVALTAAGTDLILSCRSPLGLLADAVDRFGETSTSSLLTGIFRVTTTPEFGAGFLGRVLAEFGRLHPDLRIQLVTSIDVLDLLTEQIDVAVRIGWLRDSSLRSTKVGAFRQHVVGAPEYLARTEVPTQPADLAAHRWVEHSLLSAPLRWSFVNTRGSVQRVKVTPFASGNSPPAVYGLVRGGAGLSVLPDFIVQRDLDSGRLVRVLPDWSLPEGGYYIVYPNTRTPPQKVRAFVDFFRSCAPRSFVE